MNLDFSDEQKLLRDQLRRYLAERCPSTAVRAIFEGPEPYDRQLYKGLAQMGVLGAAIPEAYGGGGLGRLELCILAEELGRVLAPTPVASSIYLAAEFLLEAGSEVQKLKWLPKLASAEAVGTLAFAEQPGRVRPQAIQTTIRNGRLHGIKSPVADGDCADIAVVAARGSKEGTEISLFLVDLNGPGVRREPLDNIDPSIDRPGSASKTRQRSRSVLAEGGQPSSGCWTEPRS